MFQVRRLKDSVPLSIVVALLASLASAPTTFKALDARHYVAGFLRTRWHQPTFELARQFALGVNCLFYRPYLCTGENF